MMKVEYDKDHNGAYQTLIVSINKTASNIFNYLSTTEGIQQWFPQLEICERKKDGKMLFHLDGEEYKEMYITDFKHNKEIGYTWDLGQVKFELNQDEATTELIFKEFLPYEFPHIGLDFAGWQFQMEKLKALIENNEKLAQQLSDFDYKKVKIEKILHLK
ncbi:SRPBCC domain-containing protein [Staphylococcus succinus]|nr:SRPBCC domain-containing protein [Staphylococcus succinus]